VIQRVSVFAAFLEHNGFGPPFNDQEFGKTNSNFILAACMKMRQLYTVDTIAVGFAVIRTFIISPSQAHLCF
jgi:hypothetical protein